MLQPINLDTWAREPIYKLYASCARPYYSVSAPVDVTPLRLYAHRTHRSFYLCLVYLVCEAANSIENFRYTIQGSNVYLMDQLHPSFAFIPKDGSDVFRIIKCQMQPTLTEFLDRASAMQRQDTKQLISGDMDLPDKQLLHLSSLPLLDASCITNQHSGEPDESTTFINWGRYETLSNGRVALSMTVEANHRLVDGIHITRFFQALRQAIETVE